MNFKLPPGVDLRRCEQDYGPATKILPALRDFAGQDVGLLFCDDDGRYPEGWLAGFRTAEGRFPNKAIACFGRHLRDLRGQPRPHNRKGRCVHLKPADLLPGQISVAAAGHVDTLLGRAGALVKPRFFTDAVFDIPPVLWAVDDIWLSGQLELAGIGIWVPRTIPWPPLLRTAARTAALQTAVIEDHDRDAANTACVQYFRQTYGIWLPPA